MATRIPDFLSLRVLRSFGVGMFPTPHTFAPAMAMAAAGVSGNWPRCICFRRRSHHTRADLISPDLDTPTGRPVLELISRPSTPNCVVECCQRPIRSSRLNVVTGSNAQVFSDVKWSGGEK